MFVVLNYNFNHILIHTLLLQDYNRVVLEKVDGVADSDYINASRVDVRQSIYICPIITD